MLAASVVRLARKLEITEMSRKSFRIISIAAAVIFVFGGAYCVLWMFASADLAWSYCNGDYSLFANTFRCRQPYIAMILAVVQFGLAVVALRVGLRKAAPTSGV